MRLIGSIFEIDLMEYSNLKENKDKTFLTVEAKNFKKVIYNNFIERLEQIPEAYKIY
jgi:hypothetical protein